MNKTLSSRLSQPVDTVNISRDADSADVERLMRQVADEMHVDAQRAIDDLKKDKELWNRVERLKQDSTTRHKRVDDETAATNDDSGMIGMYSMVGFV